MALVTAADVRAQIDGLADTTQDDAVITPLIASTEAVFARVCGYPPPSPGQRPTLESRTYVLDYAGDGGLELDLEVYPVASVSSIQQDPTGDYDSPTTVSSSAYTIVDGRRLRLKSTSSAAWFSEKDSNRVTFVAGFGGSTTLSSAVLVGATTISVVSTASITKNRSGGGRVVIGTEVVLFTGTTSTTLTGCTRGAEGTTASEYFAGTAVTEPPPQDLVQLIIDTVGWRYARRGGQMAAQSRTSGGVTEAYGVELPSSVMAALGPFMLPRAVA